MNSKVRIEVLSINSLSVPFIIINIHSEVHKIRVTTNSKQNTHLFRGC